MYPKGEKKTAKKHSTFFISCLISNNIRIFSEIDYIYRERGREREQNKANYFNIIRNQDMDHKRGKYKIKKLG